MAHVIIAVENLGLRHKSQRLGELAEHAGQTDRQTTRQMGNSRHVHTHIKALNDKDKSKVKLPKKRENTLVSSHVLISSRLVPSTKWKVYSVTMCCRQVKSGTG